jgi:hypothetical protein
MQLAELSVTGYRTVVTVLRRPSGGLRWVIIPTIHMGHADYYWAIWQRLRSCVAVIAEIYDGPSSTGLAFVNAMRLTRQRAARDLVHQDIDYGALGVPVIFPDGHLAPELRFDRRMAPEQRFGAAVMTPLLALAMAVTGGDEWMAQAPLDVDDTMRFDDLADRDALIIDVIREIHGEFAGEDMEVGVVFGAAHMPAVVRELTGNLGYRVLPGATWLTAIDFDEPPLTRRPGLDGWMDW